VKLDVECEELLPFPIEAVWTELTNAAAISDWLMVTTDFEPAVGCHFRMKTEDLSGTGWVHAEVLEVEPPRRMVWSWSAGDGNSPSTVTFELASEEGGTRLRLRHVGEFDSKVVSILRSGWPGRITALADVIRRTTGDG
jgi:uncharacterized protein YndB with AHSA1/START domain